MANLVKKGLIAGSVYPLPHLPTRDDLTFRIIEPVFSDPGVFILRKMFLGPLFSIVYGLCRFFVHPCKALYTAVGFFWATVNNARAGP